MKKKLHNQNENQLTTYSTENTTSIQTTSTQLEIWTDCLIGGSDASRGYNLCYSIRFTGEFVFKAFEHAINTLVQRHESFKALFSIDGRSMNIFEDYKIDISRDDISKLAVNEKAEAEEIITNEECNSLFDFVNGPLFKVKVIKADPSENIVVLTYHHIISDGLSIRIILEDLSILYSAYIEDVTPKLADPDLFSDYAEKTNLVANSSEYEKIEDFWLSIYKESVPVLDLPIDYPRPSLRTYNSQRVEHAVDSALLNSVKEFGNSAGCTINTTLLAAFEIFLCKITGQNDLVVGLPTAGNRRYNMQHLIGDCANLLPLRTEINTNLSFLEYVTQRNPQLLESYKHNQVSFGHLLQNLSIARDPSRIPLVSLTFTVDLNRDIENDFSFSGLSYKFKINPRKYTSFEIEFHACISNKVPTFQCNYNSRLFKEESIKNMMISFQEIISKLISEQNSPIADLLREDYLAKYTTLNDTETEYDNLSLSELLSKQGKISSNTIALEYKDIKISYKDLHIKVNQFAHYLETQGVQSGDYIAVSFPRSPELIYAILAIIQCGAAYLPLDHEYPSNRIEYMLEDSEAKFLVTSKELSLRLPKCSKTILIDDAMQSLDQYPSTKLNTYVDPENILYLLYTSGSTGKPKGAKISNRNLVNLLFAFKSEPGIKVTDRIPFISTISFDIASFELFFPLFYGAVLVLPDHETSSDGRLMHEMLIKEKISLIVGTPSTYQMLLDSGWSQKLPLKVLCCGEPLPIKLANELIKKCDELWNLYGPTEVTIFSSCKHIKDEETLISVGGPIANMQYYIVDENMNLLPPNTVGEIAIGGDGVGKGYLGKPELTAAKFLPNVFSDKDDARLYLSGDIGKLLPSNEVVCLGRVDHQVKVRGYRIEIGEVENALLSIEGIKTAVVIAKTDILIAFIIVDCDIENEQDVIRLWRNELASQLPNFMIPHVFHILEKMPTTLNDKTDRKALLEYKSTKVEQEYTAPRTDDEKLVAKIWGKILKIDQIDIYSNFFEMGGHSIMAVNVMIKIEKKTGKRIPLSALFQYATVEQFAELLSTENEISSEYLVPLKTTGTKPPLFIVHGAGLNILNFSHVIKHFDKDQPVYAFQGVGKNGYENWFESIEAMATCYIDQLITVNPTGPYALAGFSFGGVVAFEMARQLQNQGKMVSMIALLDTHLNSSYYYASYSQKKLARYCDRTYKWFDYSKEMLTSWKSAQSHANAKKNYLLKKYFGLKDNLTEYEEVAHEQFIEADRMVKKIVDRYQIIPQNLEVDLFRAKDDLNYKSDPTHLGWKKAALKGVNIHNITGNHLSIVAPPNDKILAKMIQDILDERHANI